MDNVVAVLSNLHNILGNSSTCTGVAMEDVADGWCALPAVISASVEDNHSVICLGPVFIAHAPEQEPNLVLLHISFFFLLEDTQNLLCRWEEERERESDKWMYTYMMKHLSAPGS